MRYQYIYGKENYTQTEVIKQSAQMAMDIVDSYPPYAPLQVLFNAAHRKMISPEKRRLIKTEIMILLNRRRGIESTHKDYEGEEFPLDDELTDIFQSMKENHEAMNKTRKSFNKLMRKIKIGM